MCLFNILDTLNWVFFVSLVCGRENVPPRSSVGSQKRQMDPSIKQAQTCGGGGGYNKIIMKRLNETIAASLIT